MALSIAQNGAQHPRQSLTGCGPGAARSDDTYIRARRVCAAAAHAYGCTRAARMRPEYAAADAPIYAAADAPIYAAAACIWVYGRGAYAANICSC